MEEFNEKLEYAQKAASIDREYEASLSKEEVKQEMLDYLHDKYGIEFKCSNLECASWYASRDLMYAYPASIEVPDIPDAVPDMEFKVTRDANYLITDEYVPAYFSQFYIPKAEIVVKKYYPNAVIDVEYSCGGCVPQYFMPDMNPEVYQGYSDEHCCLLAKVELVATSENDIDITNRDECVEELSQINAKGNIVFTGYSEENFQKYVIEDPYHSKETHSGYSHENFTGGGKVWGY